jgi:hypothetical protein
LFGYPLILLLSCTLIAPLWKLDVQMNFLEDLRRAVDAQTGLASALDNTTWY